MTETDRTVRTMPGGTGAVGSHPLAQLIRGRRETLGLSIRQTAERAQLSGSWLSRVERDDDPHISDQSALRIAQALELDPMEVRVAAGLSTKDEFIGSGRRETFESWIARDNRLTGQQRQALINLYRTFVPANEDDRASA